MAIIYKDTVTIGNGIERSPLIAKTVMGPIISGGDNVNWHTVARFPFEAGALKDSAIRITAKLEALAAVATVTGNFVYEIMLVDAGKGRADPSAYVIQQSFNNLSRRSIYINTSCNFSGEYQLQVLLDNLQTVGGAQPYTLLGDQAAQVSGAVRDLNVEKDIIVNVVSAANSSILTHYVTLQQSIDSKLMVIPRFFGDSITLGATGSTALGVDDMISVTSRSLSRPLMNRGIGAQTIAQITDRAMSNEILSDKKSPIIVNMGRNDIVLISGGGITAQESSLVFSAYVAAVDRLLSAGYERLAFATTPNASTETTGTTGRILIEQMRQYVLSRAPNNVIDWQGALLTGAEIAGADFFDGIHFTPAGQAKIAAANVAFINAKGW